jgi:hypothetical protein
MHLGPHETKLTVKDKLNIKTYEERKNKSIKSSPEKMFMSSDCLITAFMF